MNHALGVAGVNPFKHENILFERSSFGDSERRFAHLCGFRRICCTAALSHLKSRKENDII